MTPLTAMRGYIETLGMTELQLDSPTRERYMRIVTEETHRLERIIGDLLDLARLEGGGTAMRRERVDVGAIFTRVAARHERELREHVASGSSARGAGRRTRHRRFRPARTGAAEPGRQRPAPHAGGRRNSPEQLRRAGRVRC